MRLAVAMTEEAVKRQASGEFPVPGKSTTLTTIELLVRAVLIHDMRIPGLGHHALAIERAMLKDRAEHIGGKADVQQTGNRTVVIVPLVGVDELQLLGWRPFQLRAVALGVHAANPRAT